MGSYISMTTVEQQYHSESAEYTVLLRTIVIFKCFHDGAPPIFSPLLIVFSGLVPARYIGIV